MRICDHFGGREVGGQLLYFFTKVDDAGYYACCQSDAEDWQSPPFGLHSEAKKALKEYAKEKGVTL